MTNESLASAVMRAIEYATRVDRDNAQTNPHYVANVAERRRIRAETLLANLSGEIAEDQQTLSRALAQFLDIDALTAGADNAQAQTRQLASSEKISHPAPPAKR